MVKRLGHRCSWEWEERVWDRQGTGPWGTRRRGLSHTGINLHISLPPGASQRGGGGQKWGTQSPPWGSRVWRGLREAGGGGEM